MVAGSILPVTIHNGKLYFLFGKENKFEDSARGWSDFGGGCEGTETPYETAMREGGEELTGFLGDGKSIKKLINRNGLYKIEHKDYHVHIFHLPYDENLPKYYNQNHEFLWKRMNNKMLSESRLFEKVQIEWFSEGELKSKRSQFRSFYREIVDKFIGEIENIRSFIAKKSCRKTRKNRQN
jgi:hypothetical protein